MAYSSELTPFEWSMIQGAENGSMTFAIRLCLSGKLNSAAFESAVARTLSMHPFLSANIGSQGNTESDRSHTNGSGKNAAKKRLGKFHWVPVTDPRPYVSIAESSQPFLYPDSESIDLRKEIGVRVWARHGDDAVEMRFQFHHACCDGLGAFRMIEDLLRSYSSIVLEQADTSHLFPLDNDALALRAAEPETRLSLCNRMLRTTVILPIRITKLFAQKPDSISVLSSDSSNADAPSAKPGSFLEIPSHVFTKELTQALHCLAKSSDATLNDLLVRDLFLTIAAWNDAADSKRNRNIRLMIPFSLRTKKHAEMPAANCVSMVYMAASGKLLNNPKGLLSSVTEQRKFIRKWQIEHSWNQTAGLVASSPHISSLFQGRAKRRITTSVLTNLGQVFCQSGFPKTDGKIRCGDMVLESVVIVPPADASTAMTFGCNLYAGQLTVALNFHHRCFTESDAKHFLQAFVARLKISTHAGMDRELAS